MIRSVTPELFSQIFTQIKRCEIEPITLEELVELEKKTKAVFKQKKDVAVLSEGIKNAIEILSTEDHEAKKLRSVAKILPRGEFRTDIRQTAVTAFVERDNFDEACNMMNDLSDDDERTGALQEIIERVIEVEDFEKVLEIIDEEDPDRDMESDMLTKLVKQCIERDDEGDMKWAIKAAKKIPTDDAMIEIINHLFEKGETDQAIKALKHITEEELLADTILNNSEFLKNENNVESVIDVVTSKENKEDWQFETLEELAIALIESKEMILAKSVIDTLEDRLGEPKEMADALSRISITFIENGHTDYIIKIVNTMIDLVEMDEKCLLSITNIIKSLKEHKKNKLATEVQNLLKKLK